MTRIKTTRTITTTSWLNLFDITYADKNGCERHWQMASRGRQPKCATGRFSDPDAVVVVAFHEARNKLVVIREYRVPLAGYEYGFPAGLVDSGETPTEAARRELREETGLNLTQVLKVSPPLYSSAGMTDESVAMVYTHCHGRPATDDNEGTEQIEVLLLDRDEVGRLCSDTSLKFDAKAWLVLSRYAETGRIWSGY